MFKRAALLMLCAASTAHCAFASGAQWLRTSESNCLVWDALPQPGETVSWGGACPDGKAGGYGVEIFRYRSGASWKQERYVGTMSAGKPDGVGTLYYDNGDRYEGAFVDGERIGHGIYTHANGDRYEGDFRNDKATGHGSFYFHIGSRYEGEFVAGDFEGQGILDFPNGDRFEGSFRAGMPNGYGSFKAHTGQVAEGTWSNGCLRNGDRVAAVGTTKARCGFK